MRQLINSTYITLDGIIESPQDWPSGRHQDDGRGLQIQSELLLRCDALLLGRRTYEAFARDWPRITDPNDPFTGRMNALPKYVVTNTLTAGGWHPTTVLPGDPVQSVGTLKAQPGRELQIHGSARLGKTLLSAGLVDTLRLVVAPTVAGSGRRLLDHPGAPVGLRLVHHEVTSNGLLLLEYERVGAAPVAQYEGVAAFVQPPRM